MEDIRNFILDRRREILDKHNTESRIGSIECRKSSAASLNPLSETKDVKVNRVRFVSPATIRSTHASVGEDEIRSMPPPVLLLSNDGMFRGLRSQHEGKEELVVRQEEAKVTKGMMGEFNKMWSDKKSLDYLNMNLDSHCDSLNMNAILNKDVNSDYINLNKDHIAKIKERLGKNYKVTPVIGTGRKDKKYYEQFQENGDLNRQRRRFSQLINHPDLPVIGGGQTRNLKQNGFESMRTLEVEPSHSTLM